MLDFLFNILNFLPYSKNTWCCRFISRQDLIDWKAHLEYEFLPGVIEKVKRISIIVINWYKSCLFNHRF